MLMAINYYNRNIDDIFTYNNNIIARRRRLRVVYFMVINYIIPSSVLAVKKKYTILNTITSVVNPFHRRGPTDEIPRRIIK